MKCRLCSAPATSVFLDLGTAPPSNAYLNEAALQLPETYLPLKLYTCAACLLVQVDEVHPHDELFSQDYAYFSSYSVTWLEHSKRFVSDAVQRLGLSPQSLVMEVASNDGYLLQYVKALGIPCVGIEPTKSTAAAARARGIETFEEFFGKRFAKEFIASRGKANLIVANNVLAHVPDLNDFVSGLSLVLAEGGVLSFEFPHLQTLVAGHQFDTVYHEHFSYFSLHTVRRLFAMHGLVIWDVEKLSTHGGSLRVWAAHQVSRHGELPSVSAVLADEAATGMLSMDYYTGFQAKADAAKDGLVRFLLDCKRDGKRVAGYGAAAKGNTMLNYAGVRSDLLPYVADASPHKQGKYLPGSRIPVVSESHLRTDRPDIVLVLPWNLKDEITQQLAIVRKWGGRFATAIPALELT